MIDLTTVFVGILLIWNFVLTFSIIKIYDDIDTLRIEKRMLSNRIEDVEAKRLDSKIECLRKINNELVKYKMKKKYKEKKNEKD